MIKPNIPVQFIVVLGITLIVIFAGFVYFTNNSYFSTSTVGAAPMPSSQGIGSTSQANKAITCSVSSDCSKGGCSNQLCGKKGEIERVVTTCEYRAEYDCLRLTQCDCIQNICQWNQTQEYQNCLANITR